MLRLEQIRINPDPPSFAKPHPKGEIIWPKQYGDGWQAADLADYPQPGEEIVAWKAGAEMARELAILAEMIDDNDEHDFHAQVPDVIVEHRWFYEPFHNAHVRLYDKPHIPKSQDDEFDDDADFETYSTEHAEYSTENLLEGSVSDIQAYCTRGIRF